jgi:hypothetical protein
MFLEFEAGPELLSSNKISKGVQRSRKAGASLGSITSHFVIDSGYWMTALRKTTVFFKASLPTYFKDLILVFS